MNGNKDEAVRCIDLARSALVAGDKRRAAKFINMARRLDPCLELGDDLLASSEKLNRANVGEPCCLGHRRNLFPEEDMGLPEQPGDPNVKRSYNEDQVRVIRGVRRNKNYYAVLGLEKSCSAEDVKKAYRKLSLKVHPDKNTAPGAEEAFKSVCAAFKCLSDEQSRRNYDLAVESVDDAYDLNQPRYDFTVRRRRRRAARADYFDHDFDRDEIFGAFFYGSNGNVFHTNVNRRRARGPSPERKANGHAGGGGHVVAILMHVVLVALFLVFAALPFRQPEYSFQKSSHYVIPKITQNYGVRYFVKSEDFDQRFPIGTISRSRLEQHLVRDYKNLLGRYCRVELQRRRWAQDYATPHCDKLRSLL